TGPRGCTDLPLTTLENVRYAVPALGSASYWVRAGSRVYGGTDRIKNRRKRRDDISDRAASCIRPRSAGALRYADDLQRHGDRRAGAPADRIHNKAAGLPVSRSAADGRLCAHGDDPFGGSVGTARRRT